jgi:hypothetical protein
MENYIHFNELYRWNTLNNSRNYLHGKCCLLQGIISMEYFEQFNGLFTRKILFILRNYIHGIFWTKSIDYIDSTFWTIQWNIYMENYIHFNELYRWNILNNSMDYLHGKFCSLFQGFISMEYFEQSDRLFTWKVLFIATTYSNKE